MPITIFMNSTPDIDRLWRKVHGAGDPPITVNQAWPQPICRKATAGFDTVINDATYFNKATLSHCKDLKHIVYLGTGATAR